MANCIPRGDLPTARGCALLATVMLLAGCQGKLSVDLTDSPVDDASAVQLQIDSVELQGSDGALTRVTSDAPDRFDMLDYRDGQTLRIVDSNSGLSGDFIGLRLRFNSSNDQITTSGGDTVPIDLLSNGDFIPLSLKLGKEKSASLIVDLDLRFSLIDQVSALGVYQMSPVIRVMNADTAGSLKGTIADSLISASSCRGTRDPGVGVAVYLFDGSDVTPADYYNDGSNTAADQPIGSADVSYDSTTATWAWRFAYVAPGDYTVAWTCAADDEQPRVDDGLAFQASANARVTSQGTTTVAF